MSYWVLQTVKNCFVKLELRMKRLVLAPIKKIKQFWVTSEMKGIVCNLFLSENFMTVEAKS